MEDDICMSIQQPVIINGGNHKDHRGIITFVNDFTFNGVTRFYTIHHTNTTSVRAWQGHTEEAKYYYPVKGIWLIAWVKIDESTPQENWKAEHIILKASENKLLHLPAGYANGMKALENDSILIGFSVPGQAEEKMLRWDSKKWFDWNSIT